MSRANPERTLLVFGPRFARVGGYGMLRPSLGTVSAGRTLADNIIFAKTIVRAPGALLTASVSLLPGGTRLSVPGTLLEASVSLLPGSAGLTIPGTLLAASLSLLPGSQRVTAQGQLLTATATLLPGAAFFTPTIIVPGELLIANVSLSPGFTISSRRMSITSAKLTITTAKLGVTVREVYETRYDPWSDTKRTMRRAVHDAFAVEAIYTPPGPNPQPFACRVRWHNRGERLVGDNQGSGYAEAINPVERIVFNMDQLALIGVSKVERAGKLLVPAYNETLVLDVQVPSDGPVTQTWEVTRGAR